MCSKWCPFEEWSLSLESKEVLCLSVLSFGWPMIGGVLSLTLECLPRSVCEESVRKTEKSREQHKIKNTGLWDQNFYWFEFREKGERERTGSRGIGSILIEF